MIKTNKKITYLLIVVITCLLYIITSIAGIGMNTVYADTSANVVYTDVLADLKKDSSFSTSDYPEKANDYSLRVIQIAESVNKELFVYVYQPSHNTKDLLATKIRLSMPAVNELSSYHDYNLKQVSTNGVFDKYVVEGVTVKSDPIRYYEIVQLMRAFDSEIDEETGNDNTVGLVPCVVGQLWTVQTINGKVSYSYVQSEVIRIVQKYCGHIRLSNGYFGPTFISDSDAWFVAFKTDKRIEDLMHARVRYDWVEYYERTDPFGRVTKTEQNKGYDEEKEMDGESTGSNVGNGLWGYKWTWDRIVSISDFLAQNEGQLSSELQTRLSSEEYKGGWVLRFAETDYDSYYTGTELLYFHDYYTAVENVSILELTFKTDGKSYHMGVVDNYQSPDLMPDGEYTLTDGIEATAKAFWQKLISFVLVVLLLFLLFPLLPVVIDVVVWVIKLPFKFIGLIIKAISGGKGNKK